MAGTVYSMRHGDQERHVVSSTGCTARKTPLAKPSLVYPLTPDTHYFSRATIETTIDEGRTRHIIAKRALNNIFTYVVWLRTVAAPTLVQYKEAVYASSSSLAVPPPLPHFTAYAPLFAFA